MLYATRLVYNAKSFVTAELPTLKSGEIGGLKVEFAQKERKAIAELSEYLQTTQHDILILTRAVVTLKEEVDRLRPH